MLSFPIDGREHAARRRARDSSGTSCSARRSSATPGTAPLVHGLLHLLGYEHGTEMERPRANARGMTATPDRERSSRRTPRILQSLNWAFEGVIHVLRTQRNMRIHFALATVVLILAFSYGVTKLELMALLVAISFVLIAEMVNTAIEATIDLATTSFDPLAKMAKDIAAGAVLIAAVNAVVIGYLVFADRLSAPSSRLVERAPRGAEQPHADRPDPRSS